MSILNQIVERTFVDGVNKLSRSPVSDTVSTFATISLDVDWEDLAKDTGKKSLVGGALDGVFGLYKASLFYKNGHIDKKTFAKYVLSEIGCGVSSSAMGNISSITVKILTGNQAASVLVGVGVSSGTRWVYREYMPKILPDLENEEEEEGELETEEVIRKVLNRFRE